MNISGLRLGRLNEVKIVDMTPADAEAYGFEDGRYVKLNVQSTCSTTFDRLLCRVDPKFLLEVHIDTDEGNACDLVNATTVQLLG